MKSDITTGEGQRRTMRATDPARRMGEIFRSAEELGLTRANVRALQERRPEHYACLDHWRAADERAG